MSELHLPKHVQLDLHPFYCYPDPADWLYSRIGVVTQVELGKDSLHVKAGVSDDSTHDILAARIRPGKDQRITLPPEMYTRQGLAVAWYYPNLRGRVGGAAGPMVNRGLNREARLTQEQTKQCLEMAALAITLFVVQSPSKVLEQEDLSNITVDKEMLAEAEKQFSDYIGSA